MVSNRNKLTIRMKSAREKSAAGNFEGAIADYTKAIDRRLADKSELGPVDKNRLAEAYNGRGIAKIHLGRSDKAAGDFDEAIRLCIEVILLDPKKASAPRKASAWNNHGIAKIGHGSYEEAIADCTKAMEIGHADKKLLSFAYNNRGAAKAGLGRHEEAIADCTKAIDLKPTDKNRLAEAYSGRSASKNQIGDYQGAIEDSTKAIEINPKNAASWNNRGASKNQIGDYQGAIEDSTKAIEINPKNAASWNNRGLAKYRLGKYEEAIADYNEAIRLDPKNTTALNNRAAVETQNAIRDSVGEGVNEIKKAEEFKKQAEEYERREKINRRGAYVAMVGLAGLIVFLVATIIVPNLPSEYFPKLLPEYSSKLPLKCSPESKPKCPPELPPECSPESKSECLPELNPVDIKNLFNLLPLITLIIIITSPLVWTTRLLIAAANKAELMRAEYRHLALVERRMFVYFAEDDTDEGKQIRADYIKATMTNSPADKLVALQNKANAPSPNFVETIRSKIIDKSSS